MIGNQVDVRSSTDSQGRDEGFLSTITIDEEATEKFRKEGRIKAPNFKIVRMGARQFLLKTSIWYLDQEDNWINSDRAASLYNPPNGLKEDDDSYDMEYRRRMFNEQRAYHVAKLIGASMAETKYVDFNGTPCVAYEYLGNVRDRAWGRGIVFSENADLLRQQEDALAKGALLKFLLNDHEDGGQYLQDEKGELYISDIGAIANEEIDDINNRKALLQIFEHRLFFGLDLEALAHQLAGMSRQDYNNLLQELSSKSQEDILNNIAISMESPTEDEKLLALQIATRARIAATLFPILAQNPEDVIMMLNPIQGEDPNQRVVATSDSEKSRMTLFGLARKVDETI